MSAVPDLHSHDMSSPYPAGRSLDCAEPWIDMLQREWKTLQNLVYFPTFHFWHVKLFFVMENTMWHFPAFTPIVTEAPPQKIKSWHYHFLRHSRLCLRWWTQICHLCAFSLTAVNVTYDRLICRLRSWWRYSMWVHHEYYHQRPRRQ